ncbi:TraR/DksA C4-type zinc finger protein [Kosakonia oryzae]|uniref:Phage/conjugal plasmid C-4 type zinc finger protein, TraR family n=1 Tax=Kosakonia oryzae TaxID=497725 RepID=A0AA94H4T5_9ENTR|nr:TraR/DksA C4-type zinc finger protein [Kosakonia oryzae]ANI81801.1 TraR/DksA C4-type zinc finger protein [Kosakonia oryzae]SFC73433.1 phage/conjugal plasmid C-4 type zinc finger protein, TraR family [Kosakonia oryzae]
MADEMDLVQQRELDDRERYIRQARHRLLLPSRLTCECCDAPIPQARRMALPGVTCCVSCQQLAELKDKHYRRR